MKSTGIVLILLGLLLTVFTAANFFTKKKVVDLGEIEITREEPHNISWSPVVGVLLMGIGAVVLWKGGKK